MKWKWVRSVLLAVTASVTLAQLPIYEVNALPACLALSPLFFGVIVALDQREKAACDGTHKRRVESKRECVWFDLIVPEDEVNVKE